MTTPPVLDHLVLATPTLDATARRLERALGVEVAPGGSHVGRGTRNRLVSLGAGAYLEVIGVDEGQPAPAGPRPFGVDDLAGERLVAWAVRVEGIDELCASSSAAGYDPGPVAAMSRMRPDGVLLSWRLTAPGALPVAVLPFVIDWGTSPHPTSSLADGAVLVGMRAEHPRADHVAGELAALGVALEVSAGPAARLVAVLAGPAGRVELS